MPSVQLHLILIPYNPIFSLICPSNPFYLCQLPTISGNFWSPTNPLIHLWDEGGNRVPGTYITLIAPMLRSNLSHGPIVAGKQALEHSDSMATHLHQSHTNSILFPYIAINSSQT